jgi:hypothetical protein
MLLQPLDQRVVGRALARRHAVGIDVVTFACRQNAASSSTTVSERRGSGSVPPAARYSFVTRRYSAFDEADFQGPR